ncbi:MAG TPA: phosphatase PAP2 family protein [Candidatus Binatia bacterium]|nr:phosphatase PAP2 family protein [Candidatus Binatia bacterium]
MSRSELYATWALLAALTILVSLHWIIPIDEWAYRWVQFHRTCAVERAVLWIDPTVRGILATLIAVALVRRGWRSPWYLLGLVILFLAGAAATELLKTAIERLRPNSTPGTITGNSFPSGHTTGATMAAIIAILLIRAGDWRPFMRWSGYAIAVSSVFLQAVGRLLNGSHWLSDVCASMLLGSAWVLGAGRLQRLPRAAVGSLLALGCLAFIVFDGVPGIRLRLPSAIDESPRWLASIEFGTPESRPTLVGRWENGPAEPIGPVSWALSPDVSVVLRAVGPPVGILKVTVRPGVAAEKRRTCARMVITVNQWVAPEIALVRGWREYHLDPPAGAFRVGDNTIRFHIVGTGEASGKDVASGLAAFRYLRLYPPT